MQLVHDIYIDKLADVTNLLLDQKYNSSINQLGSVYFFRETPDVEYDLATSISRGCKGKQAALEPIENWMMTIENGKLEYVISKEALDPVYKDCKRQTTRREQ